VENLVQTINDSKFPYFLFSFNCQHLASALQDAALGKITIVRKAFKNLKSKLRANETIPILPGFF